MCSCTAFLWSPSSRLPFTQSTQQQIILTDKLGAFLSCHTPANADKFGSVYV